MRGDESRITSLRVRGKLTDKADVAWRPLGVSSASRTEVGLQARAPDLSPYSASSARNLAPRHGFDHTSEARMCAGVPSAPKRRTV